MLTGKETPRIWTRPLRPLTPETSRGFECIEFAEDVLRVTLFPWQKWFLIHALELNPDGSYRFETVLLLVARQNGKTLIMVVLALWRMYLDDVELVIGTAQKLDVAKEAWQVAVNMAYAVPALKRRISGLDRTHGEESLEVDRSKRYRVAAAGRRGGRGLSAGLVLLDELREHQSWDAWAAITNTTLAKTASMVFCFSNAGDSTSIVLRTLRTMALWGGDVEGGEEDRLLDEWARGTDAADLEELFADSEDLDVDDVDADTIGIFEWSAVPGRDKWIRDSWAQANPSLGFTITVKKLAGFLKLPDHVCRPENLCEWSSTSADGPFPAGTWESCRNVVAQSPLLNVSPLSACVDVSWDRSTSHITVAGLVGDEIHIDVMASRGGTEWVLPWLKDRRDKFGGVVLQSSGAPVSSLLQSFKDAGLPVVEWTGAELGRAHGSFYDSVTAGAFRVPPHPVLDRAAATARTKPIGDAWVFDRKNSPQDASPLIAAVGAAWGLGQIKPAPESAYERGELEFV